MNTGIWPRLSNNLSLVDAPGQAARENAWKNNRNSLMVGLPEQGILITQDLVYNRVHAMVGEKAFDSGTETLEKAKNESYNKVLPGHGAPGGKELYSQMQHYLSTARNVNGVATDGEDMKDKMIQAFPDYGGVGMLDQQKRFLFPGTKG